MGGCVHAWVCACVGVCMGVCVHGWVCAWEAEDNLRALFFSSQHVGPEDQTQAIRLGANTFTC